MGKGNGMIILAAILMIATLPILNFVRSKMIAEERALQTTTVGVVIGR